MSDIINLLPDSVANQIAAGEVIDRPASAVKELLENSVDAGAHSVQLIIKDAGRTLIQVIDDGSGMSDNDARLCFERHATSKIRRANDLFNIRTMGFRGEALASIAAVAQVELRTRRKDDELGTAVIIEGSDVKSQEPCSCPVGTNLMIKNLFYNIPARRSFLKKDAIELSHIEEIFRRVALVYCQTAFSLYSNGKLLYDLKAGNMAQRIVALFGSVYQQRLVPVDEKNDVLEIHGFVCKPEHVRKIRGEQYLFVNDRFIRHANLSSAVEKAYADLIPERSFPSYFLSMRVDPSRLDVNIHPTKTEVRFIDEHAIFAILRAATKRALGQFALGGEISFDRDPELEMPLPQKGVSPQAPQLHLNPNYNPFNKNHGSSQTDSPAKNTPSDTAMSQGAYTARPGAGSGITPDRNKWENFFNQPATLSATQNTRQPATQPTTPADNPLHPTATAPGQDNQDTVAPVSELSTTQAEAIQGTISTVDNRQFIDEQRQHLNLSNDTRPTEILNFQGKYLIATMPDSLLIVNIQRAQERIFYEQLQQKAASSKASGAQMLLIPVTCTFSAVEAEILKELAPDLRQIGFDIQPVGITGIVISATPTDVNDNDLKPLLENIVADYKNNLSQQMSDRHRNLFLSMAHQMSLRSKKVNLTQQEMQSILASLFSCQMPNLSPYGKKTLITMRESELQDFFR